MLNSQLEVAQHAAAQAVDRETLVLTQLDLAALLLARPAASSSSRASDPSRRTAELGLGRGLEPAASVVDELPSALFALVVQPWQQTAPNRPARPRCSRTRVGQPVEQRRLQHLGQARHRSSSHLRRHLELDQAYFEQRVSALSVASMRWPSPVQLPVAELLPLGAPCQADGIVGRALRAASSAPG